MSNRNAGKGFVLPPAGDRGRQLPNTAPLPEAMDAGDWLLEDSEPLESKVELSQQAGGIMCVPLHDSSAAAQLIRNHEMGHSRWTPRNLPPEWVNDFASQLAEDARVWKRLASSGVPTDAAAMPAEEMLRRFAAAPDPYVTGLLVATAGTGDGINARHALQAADPVRAARLIPLADAIHERYFSEEWPPFSATVQAADAIRQGRLPDPPEEQPEEGEEGDSGGQGEGEGSDSDSGGQEGDSGPQEGEEGDSDSNGSDGSQEGEEAEGEGEGEGGQGEEGKERELPPTGTGGRPGKRQPSPSGKPKLSPQQKGAIKRRLNKQDKAKAAAIADAKEKVRIVQPDPNLSPEEQAAGERTAAHLGEMEAEYGSYSDKGPIESGEMTINKVRLTHMLPARMRGRRYRPSDFGGRIGNPAGVHSGSPVFRARNQTKGGGTLLIDCSGSMSLQDEAVMEILEIAPAVCIATYNGNGETGELRIIAANGRRADAKDFQARQGCNTIDEPALEWLAAQPSRPRIWVSDGIATGKGDRYGPDLWRRVAAICKRAGIHRVNDLEELRKLARK